MRGRAKFTLSVIVVALAGFAAALTAPSLLSPQRVKQRPRHVLSPVLAAAKTPTGSSNALSLEQSLKREKELRLVLESQQEGFIEEIFRLKQRLNSLEARRGQSKRIEQEEMQGGPPGGDLGLREKQLRAENAELKARLSAVQSQVGAQYDSSSQISLLQAKTSELSAELAQCEERAAEGDRFLRDLGNRQKEFHLITKQAAARERALQACTTELESSKNRLLEMEELKKDLVSAKSELRLQETERALLGGTSIGDSQVKSPQLQELISERAPSPSNTVSSQRASAVPSVPDVQKGLPRVNSEPEQPHRPNKEVLVVEVARTKINLRSGPGREHSPLIQVPRGSRLVVEDRVGDWYRVITPTGARAYVRSDVVRVLSGGSSAQLYGEAAPETSSRTAPGKPPVRVSKDDAALVPFGSVKLGGRSSGTRDPEEAAYERLKTMLQSSGVSAKENEVKQ